MRTYLKFSLIVFLPIFLTGCLLNSDSNVDEGGPEVLLAQECGLDGLRCCQTQPACAYGQNCCDDPNGSGLNRCADDCGCGGPDQFCCPGSEACRDGFVCLEGSCTACGGEGEPCCAPAGGQAGGSGPAAACRNVTGRSRELVCYGGSCVACGEPGGPCCGQGEKCLGKNQDGEVECLSGSCVACGLDGQPACSSGPECAKSHLSSRGSCLRCGAENQPCCRGEDGQQTCEARNGLVCNLGFCQR